MCAFGPRFTVKVKVLRLVITTSSCRSLLMEGSLDFCDLASVFPYKWLCLNTKYVKQFFCITWLMSLANGWTLNPHTSHWVFIYSDRCYCVIINQSYFISCLFHLLNNADVEMSSVFLQLADTEALSRPPEAKSE